MAPNDSDDSNKPSNINDNQPEHDDDDGPYIFVASFRHHITGKIVRRADGRPFRIPVNRRSRASRKSRRKPSAE